MIKYCIDLYPGIVYYIAECGCILTKDQVIKRKKVDILNSRTPLVNCCPNHKETYFIKKRVVACIDCGEISYFDPKSGGLSERCRVCGRKHSQLKAKIKYRAIAKLKKEKEEITIPEYITEKDPIVFEKENMKIFKDPMAALTVEQAKSRGVQCIPLDLLFRSGRVI